MFGLTFFPNDSRTLRVLQIIDDQTQLHTVMVTPSTIRGNSVGPISSRDLFKTTTRLERRGYVASTMHPCNLPGVRYKKVYTLTKQGKSLLRTHGL